jgi:hypothetical protein
MRYLLDSWSSKISGSPESAARSPLRYEPGDREALTVENGLVRTDSLFQK